MSWLEYFRLLEKYGGEIGPATAEELQSAWKGNPNDPVAALELARKKYRAMKQNELMTGAKVDPVAAEECEECGGTGEVTTMEQVYPGEPHTAPIGTAPCRCQWRSEE